MSNILISSNIHKNCFRKSRKEMEEIKSLYEKQPSLCQKCNKKLEFKKRKCKYCSNSCAASCNNKNINRNKEYYRIIYENNPKICKVCKNKIPYNNRNNKTCSEKCSYKKSKIQYFCITCNKEIKNQNKKYCNNKCKITGLWEKIKSDVEKTGTFEKYSVERLRKYFKETQEWKCSICKNTHWMDQKIDLVVDHIDGNSQNNKLVNLRLLCNNCDAQTPTYKAKNKGNGRAYRRIRYSEGKSY